MDYNPNDYLVINNDLYAKLKKKVVIVDDEAYYKASSTVHLDGKMYNANTVIKHLKTNYEDRIRNEEEE